MKNLFQLAILFIFSAVIIIACTKEEEAHSHDFLNAPSLENRDNSVWICHKPDGNNPHAIMVDESAVEAHLGHGDVLLDADGDGYTAMNECGEGSMDDCDDNDASINPGAEEVCGDGIDNDCDGEVDEDCLPEGCWTEDHASEFVADLTLDGVQDMWYFTDECSPGSKGILITTGYCENMTSLWIGMRINSTFSIFECWYGKYVNGVFIYYTINDITEQEANAIFDVVYDVALSAGASFPTCSYSANLGFCGDVNAAFQAEGENPTNIDESPVLTPDYDFGASE